MYNRYIPQSDGTYSRKSIHQQTSLPPNPVPPPQEPPQIHHNPPEPVPPKPASQSGIPGFLRQLLPKEFDTGDLLIVLLLLLMAGDCEEEKHNALLTLALYFIM